VARAIMHKPQILFLDEPTAGLDPQSRIALWEIMQELHAIGQTIMLTTHYMEEADQLCDRVAIMDHGRILALDTPAGLKQSLDADSIVRINATGDLDRLARHLTESVDGATAAKVVEGSIELWASGRSLLPRDQVGLQRVVHLALAGAERGQAVLKPLLRLARLLLDDIEIFGLRLEINLAGQRGLGEILASLTQGELGFRGELFGALGEHLLLTGGLQPARHRRLEFRLHLVDGAVGLADSLAHHGVAAGLLHAIHRILDGRREQTGDTRKD